MNIPLLDLVTQYHSIQPEIQAAIQRVLESGHFIMGPEVAALEQEVAAYLGVDHAVGVASGTDALILSLRALEVGPGDEVILPAYTFFATAGAILHVGATPVFVDIDPVTYNLDPAKMDPAITGKTKAIIPVHLYGHPADMDPILEIARAHSLKVIEDNAQAFGASYKDRKAGAIGDIGCLSFFPSKNLGAYGDAGMLVTSDPVLAEKSRMLRTHGWKRKYYPEMLGYNSRLDALQAAILRVKLPHVDAWNAARRSLAQRYVQLLSPHGIQTPHEVSEVTHAYHQYVVRLSNRDEVRHSLKEAGIGCDIYYPQPPYLAEPVAHLGHQPGDFPNADAASQETVALPIFPEMSAEQQETVVSVLLKAALPIQA